MKKFKIIATAVVALVFFVIYRACTNTTATNPPIKQNTEVITDSLNIIALATIKKEPKVKDAVITDAKVLYISVLDDGTDRSGYASYCCTVMKEMNADVKVVKVVAFGTMNNKKKDSVYGILIGETRCNL